MKQTALKKLLILFSIAILMSFLVSCSQSVSPVQSNNTDNITEPLLSDGSDIEVEDDVDVGGDKYNNYDEETEIEDAVEENAS